MIVPETADDTTPVKPPGEEVAVYVVIVSPPLERGAVKVTVAEAEESTDAVPIVGAPGTVRGVTPVETVDVAPVPATLVALTRNVYDVPFVKPVTVADTEVEVPSANTEYAPPLLNSTT